MSVSLQFLQRCAAETAYRPGALEKAIRLGEIAADIGRHPFLGTVLALCAMTHLGRLCHQIYPIREGSGITRIPAPDDTQTKILKAIGVIWPTQLNNTRVKV